MRILFATLLFALSLFAEPISWSSDFNSAFGRAVTEKKPLLIYVTQPHCRACTFMEEKVFPDTAVSGYVNARYVALKLQLGDKSLPSHLQPFGTPTFYVLNRDQSEVTDAVVGGKNSENFLFFLEEGVDYYQIKNRKENQ